MTGLSGENKTSATLSSKILILGMSFKVSRLPSPSQTFAYADNEMRGNHSGLKLAIE
jgi:hypothetical protein